jgi:NAD-dependent dihydropyrimidine dehydrogenase PreA subunit
MFLPVIKADICTRCLACCRICPKMVLDEKDKDICVSNATLCTGCASCSAVCPEEAIEVKEI